jgi:hypothetical protein
MRLVEVVVVAVARRAVVGAAAAEVATKAVVAPRVRKVSLSIDVAEWRCQ